MQTTSEKVGGSSRVGIPEAELLVECLRETPIPAPANIDWTALLSLCENHRVLPLVHRALVASGAEIPQDFLDAVRDSRCSTVRLGDELELLIASFAQYDVEVIPLKGPMLAEALYGDLTMRPCSDLDLLVRRADCCRAEKVLTDAGWIASDPADDYQRKFVRDDHLVELHFGVVSPRTFPFDLNGAWNRTRNAVFRGYPVKMFSEIDLCLYLMLHGLKHGYGKLIWILDAALALKVAAEKSSAQELVERAKAQNLENVFYIGCAMVCEVFPQQVPDGLIGSLAEAPQDIRYARAFVEKLLNGDVITLTGLDNWSFHLQIESDPIKRWRRRLMFFIPTSEDYKWASDYRIPGGLVPLLRPFRLLAKHGFLQAWRTSFPRD